MNKEFIIIIIIVIIIIIIIIDMETNFARQFYLHNIRK
jgi:hypothetical protein